MEIPGRVLVDDEETLARYPAPAERLGRPLGVARSEAIQLLGLLAAVIAFVVGTTSIAVELDDFDISGRLLVLLTGAILLVFASFGAALDRPGWRHAGLVALGLLVAAFAVFWWSAAE